MARTLRDLRSTSHSTSRRSLLGCALCLTAAGCAGTRRAPSSAAEGGHTERRWVTRLNADHPLVGKIWHVARRSFVESEFVPGELSRAKFVLLGEKHDNPDHHRLQAELIEGLVRRGRAPAVALEMLEVEQQAAVDAYRKSPGASAAGFGSAVGWEKTSWPPYETYEPVARVAFAAELPVLAANLSHETVRALVKGGLSTLDSERAAKLRLDVPFPPELEADLARELSASHCGMLPEHALAPMALAQHARDAQMARVMLDAGRNGAVLIAGAGHVRLDRGVPHYLRLEAPQASIGALAFREVDPKSDDPASYVEIRAGAGAPFDYVWFTPRASDEDPCAAFQRG